jgi:RNA polymerase sigma-70 factor, ECF subfamily
MDKDCNIFEVWDQYKTHLYQFIYKRVKNEQDSKDLLHDVLIKTYQFCSKGKPVLYLKSWLFKVTHNAIADYHNKRNSNKFSAIDDCHTADSDLSSVYREASIYIKALVKLLPEKYSSPLIMSDLDDMDQKAIAQQLGLSLTAAKSRIQRARKKLKECFLRCCLVEFDDNGEMISFDIKPQCKALIDDKGRSAPMIVPSV